ncbi:unnamed protein product [Caretta caretta]
MEERAVSWSSLPSSVPNSFSDFPPPPNRIAWHDVYSKQLHKQKCVSGLKSQIIPHVADPNKRPWRVLVDRGAGHEQIGKRFNPSPKGKKVLLARAGKLPASARDSPPRRKGWSVSRRRYCWAALGVRAERKKTKLPLAEGGRLAPCLSQRIKGMTCG